MIVEARKRSVSWLVAVCMGVAVTACSHSPTKSASKNTAKNPDEIAVDEDPWAPFNRSMYSFNKGVDTMVLRPITVGYRTVVPTKGREMVSNAVDNLYTPVVFANSVLQADPQNTFASFWRFIINSTVGIGGLFDVASEAGLKNRPADFGQTLAVYGVGSGPYLVLPLVGPSNPRDGIGRVADGYMNPFNYFNWETTAAIAGVTAVDARSRNMKLIDDIYETSLDPYSTFRSGYTQKRASDIKRAKESRKQALDKAANNK